MNLGISQVVAMDTKKKEISLDDGHVISYDKCLLATGGQPKTLPLFENASDHVKKHVSQYREVCTYTFMLPWRKHDDYVQIRDFLTLDELLEKKKTVLVVGGSFLGTELAVGMATRCKLHT